MLVVQPNRHPAGVLTMYRGARGQTLGLFVGGWSPCCLLMLFIRLKVVD